MILVNDAALGGLEIGPDGDEDNITDHQAGPFFDLPGDDTEAFLTIEAEEMESPRAIDSFDLGIFLIFVPIAIDQFGFALVFGMALEFFPAFLVGHRCLSICLSVYLFKSRLPKVDAPFILVGLL